MMFLTHLVISVFCAFFILPFLGMDHIVHLVVFLLGSIIPDIDIVSSKIGRRFKLGYFFKHRGIFHSYWMMAALSLPFLVIDIWVGVAFLLGYALHLNIDMLNPAGVRVFYPFFRIKGPIRTKSFAEYLIMASFLFLGISLYFI